MPHGLSRTQRLCRAADFNAVRRSEIKVRDSLFNVNVSRHQGVGRIGIAVSRRVSPKAVERNRIKRQIRESFRLHQAMLQGLDIVVVANPAASAANNGVLSRSLHTHWQHLVTKCAKR